MTAKPIRVVPINGANGNQLFAKSNERQNPIHYFSVQPPLTVRGPAPQLGP